MRKTLACLLLLLAPASGVVKAGMLGLTPIGNVGPSVATFTDTAPVDGVAYAYWITAQAAPCPAAPTCGESGASNTVPALIPPTGTHTVTLSWTPSTSSGVVSQNIYRVSAPLAPTGASGAIN